MEEGSESSPTSPRGDVRAKVNRLEATVEKIAETVKSFTDEVEEIRTNLELSNEAIQKLAGQDVCLSDHERFGRFVGDSLAELPKTMAEQAILEIVDVLFKYRNRASSQKQ